MSKFLLLIIQVAFFSSRIRSDELVSSISNSEKPIVWSILICTIEKRREVFDKLYKKLFNQIDSLNLTDQIEILFFRDNQTLTIGYKRNCLLEKAAGEYINFIDDDDDVHPEYIKMIYEKLQSKPDCISLLGIINPGNKNQQLFIHSINYNHYYLKDDVYYRPPNHLNTIKRSIALLFKFPPLNCSEDTDWAMQIARSGLLKNEEVVSTPYYFYTPHKDY